MSEETDSAEAFLDVWKAQAKPSILSFVRLEHGPSSGTRVTKATSKLSGSSWTTFEFSLDWVRSLPICRTCGRDLLEGERALCSPCEAAEVMPLIRAFQQDLQGI